MKNKGLGAPVLVGIPFDGQSSYLRGAGDAPPKIREAMACDASNKWTESGVDLGASGIYEDAGDLAFSEEKAFAAIEERIGSLIDSGKRPVSLGGDHSITFPIVKAFGARYPELTIFHFDAHPDLYDEFEGNRLSHACPFARIMEAGLAKRLVQVGNSDHQPASAGTGAQVWSGGRRDARASGLREVESGGAGVHHVRYGCTRSGLCARDLAP